MIFLQPLEIVLIFCAVENSNSVEEMKLTTRCALQQCNKYSSVVIRERKRLIRICVQLKIYINLLLRMGQVKSHIDFPNNRQNTY